MALPGAESIPERVTPNENDIIVVEPQGESRKQSPLGRVLVTQHGSHTRWDDLRAPATTINPPGAVSDPDIDVDGTLLFDDTTVEQIPILFQMAHDWKIGSSIYPHVHWSKTDTSAGNIVWQMRYRLMSVGESAPAWSAWQDVQSSSGAPLNTENHTVSGFGAVDMSGQTLSCIVSIQIRRAAGEAEDNYSGDARLWEVDIHYEKDALGSASQFEK